MNIFQQTEVEPPKPKGENVIWITRITGYFSRVQSWNPAKKQELIDRHRSDLNEQVSGYFTWYKG